MIHDPAGFLESLMRWAAGRLAQQDPPLAIRLSSPRRQLWRNRVVEADADPAGWTVLRIYGGPPVALDGSCRVSVQGMTEMTGGDAALTRAQQVYEAVSLDAIGRSLHSQLIPAFTVEGVPRDGKFQLIATYPLQPPGILGVLNGKTQVVFNTDFRFVFLPNP